MTKEIFNNNIGSFFIMTIIRPMYSLMIYLLFFATCSNPGEYETHNTVDRRAAINILFVGNSLTYTNNLPELLTEIAKQDSIDLHYSSLLYPNYSIEDHLVAGNVQTEIKNGDYDFAVVQQGPSALPESQIMLMRDAKKLEAMCSVTAKTKLALFMVWPSADRSFDLDNVIYSYGTAAESTRAVLCPAGLAWKIGWQLDASLPLYSNDNFHPSKTGSVLSALAIYGALLKKDNFDSVKLIHMSWKNEMTEERLSIVKQAALQAIQHGYHSSDK